MWLPFLASLLLGVSAGSWLAFVLVLAGLVYELVKNKSGVREAREEARGALLVLRKERGAQLVLLFFLVLAALLGYVYYTHSFEQKADGLYSGGYAWGDMAFHATLASSFLYGENLPLPYYPVYAGQPLGYPFLSDFLASTLGALGGGLGFAFWASAWLAVVVFCLLAYSLANSWLGKRRFAALAVIALFLLSGGLGFLKFFDGLSNGGAFNSLVLAEDYGKPTDGGIDYSNMLNSILLPARSALFGMVLAIASLLLLTRAVDNGLKNKRELVAAGVLGGLVPLVHTHSFLALSFVAVVYAVLFHKGEWKKWAWFFVPLALLALPQVIWSAQQLAASTSSFLRVHTGWLSNAAGVEAWLVYWARNAGAFIVLLIPAALFAPRRVQKLAAPLLALFVIGNLFAFQPYVYDNIKLFAYFQLAGAVLVALMLAKLWEKRAVWKVVALALLVLCTLSGGLAMAREVQLSWVMVNSEGVAFAEQVRASTEPGAIFLTGSEHTHPVPVLAGRTILLGYKGWLWTHGISYSQREQDVAEIYRGGSNARALLQKYEVSYVVVGPPERREFGNLNPEFFEQNFEKALQVGGYILYRVS